MMVAGAFVLLLIVAGVAGLVFGTRQPQAPSLFVPPATNQSQAPATLPLPTVRPPSMLTSEYDSTLPADLVLKAAVMQAKAGKTAEAQEAFSLHAKWTKTDPPKAT